MPAPDTTSNTSANTSAAASDLNPERRKALLALALLVPAPSLGTAMAMYIAPGPVGQAVYGLAKVYLFVFPLLWWLLVDRGGPSLSPVRKGGLGVGLGIGVAISAAILGAYFLVGQNLVEPAQVQAMAAKNRLDTPARYLGFAAYLILVNSLLEEFVWRWFVFRKCETLMPGYLAVGASALFFTLHHILALKVQFGWLITLAGALGVFAGGAIWSALYLRYRSIWPGYLSHAVVDVAILLIGWWLIFGG